MNSNCEEMMYDSEDSESDYEVILLNPNINYESEDDSGMEDFSQNSGSSPTKHPEATQTEIHAKINQEVEAKNDKSLIKTEEASCDSIALTAEDENSMSSNDSMNCTKAVRRKLNLEEYKMRRANEKPQQQPLFDVPRKVAAFELCDTPATLPLFILPTDPSWIKHNQQGLKQETDNLSKSPIAAFNPSHYEEITILSMGCNTEITIPPNHESVDSNEKFMKTLVQNLKTEHIESLLSSSTSLFSSIQAVVQGKCASTETEIVESPTESSQHGEDKIIMYLRKDRLRPFKCSAGTQTESMSLFPPLLLTPTVTLSRPRSRNYRRRVSRSRSRSRTYSPSGEYDRVRYNKRYTRSQHSTHSSSMNSSDSSGSDSESDSMSYISSSDSLKRFNDRQNFKFYNRNQNQGYSLQGERRVIYIGGLEEETTKDEIRRKFLNYGTIKKISLHSKENGLRYGFVTFEDASCAYEVLGTFTKDQRISKYDIRFGGRRHFCKQSYADLDSMPDSEYVEPKKPAKDLSFEDLLKLAKKEISCKK